MKQFKLIVKFTILAISMFFTISCIGPKPKVITVQVISKDEGGKPLEGAQVVVSKGKESRQLATLENGRTTIETKYATPFQLRVSYPFDESFLDAEIEITDNDFPGDRQQIFKEVYIEKKKTTITGRIVDWETKKPVPVVSVRVEPGISTIIDSDTSGVFTLQSPDFKEGVMYTIYFTRSRPYKNRRYHDLQKNVEDIALFQTVDMGTVEMESTVIENPGPSDGEMEIKTIKGEMPSIE